MADIKTSELTVATSASDTDRIVILADPSGTPVTKTIAKSNLISVSFGRTNKTQADSPYSVSADDVDGFSWFTNTGATGETIFNLPAGSDGYYFLGMVTAAQYMRFAANGSETFRFKSSQSSAGGYIRSDAIGNVITGRWSGTEWVVEILGVWLADE